jgi:ArsR family transcriptional regulator, arsenate/arsenite/antimonite-responsive transcriptional repressor
MKPQANREETAQANMLAVRLRALGHPVRLRILAALADNNACQCGDIVRGLPLAQSTVSEHLRILREAGLVRGETEGRRACYCLDRAAVRQLAGDFDRLLAAIGREEKVQTKDPVERRVRKSMQSAERN